MNDSSIVPLYQHYVPPFFSLYIPAGTIIRTVVTNLTRRATPPRTYLDIPSTTSSNEVNNVLPYVLLSTPRSRLRVNAQENEMMDVSNAAASITISGCPRRIGNTLANQRAYPDLMGRQTHHFVDIACMWIARSESELR
jgi:hypothetical protein